MRAFPEDLLVDGLQQHHDCSLQHLVFESRNPDGPCFAPISLRDVHPPHGRCAVVAGLGTLEQRPEIGLEILLVLLRRDSVDSRCAVLPGSLESFSQPADVHVVRQRLERRSRMSFRQLCYPLLFR